jgi:hypothetical protein
VSAAAQDGRRASPFAFRTGASTRRMNADVWTYTAERARDGRRLGVASVLSTSPMFGRPPRVLFGRLVMTLGRARIAYAFGPLGGATFNLRHAVVHRGRTLMGPCEAFNGLRSAARHR